MVRVIESHNIYTLHSFEVKLIVSLKLSRLIFWCKNPIYQLFYNMVSDFYTNS